MCEHIAASHSRAGKILFVKGDALHSEESPLQGKAAAAEENEIA
jgi:hypothetical protein